MPKRPDRHHVALVLLATAALLAACSESSSSISTEPKATVAPTASSAGDGVDRSTQQLQDWLDRLDGRTVSYVATLACPGPCNPGATWSITETDGVITVVELDQSAPSRDGIAPLSLTAAIQRAVDATGEVEIVESTETSLKFQVDPLAEAIDDEFIYTATGILLDQ